VNRGVTSIYSSFGLGAGFDTGAIVRELVAAERAPRLALLDQRQARVDARISALAQFQSAFDALTGALDSRISSGAIGAIPRVSDPSILAISVAPGRLVPARSLEVLELARPQALASAPVADPAAAIGEGTLTIRFGTVAGRQEAEGFAPGTLADLVIEVGPGRDSLTGLRDAINDAAAQADLRLTAEIVSDPSGSRLVVRGATGAGQGFIVEASTPELEPFAFTVGGGGLERTAVAADAELALDGLTIRRTSNSFADLVPGVDFRLLRAAPGTQVVFEARQSPGELAATIADLAGALNELVGLGREFTRGQGAPGTPGALVADSAARRAVQSLVQLTTRALVAPDGDAPARLADIGLTLDRQGNFQIDNARLQQAVEAHPGRVEAMLRELGRSGSFVTAPGPLKSIAADLRAAASGRAGQPTALQREARSIAVERARLDARMNRFEAQLARQYGTLDRQVGQSRQTLAFLAQQIDIWFPRERR
jgi:flagellar hook-associated protein 2